MRHRPVLLIAAVLALARLAHADLCLRPDGTYTNHCTKDDGAVTGGTVSRSDAARPAPADPPAPPRTRAVRIEEPSVEDERYWRDRLSTARRALTDAQHHLDYVLASNGAGAADRGQVSLAVRQVQEAREYLEEGLPEECRRSEHCLPVWVR
jgi:hypothetical protein